MGTIETDSADQVDPGRHEFTPQERKRGGRRNADRAQRRREMQRQRFRNWLRRDSHLWSAYQHAQAFGTRHDIGRARKAWSDHQLVMPIRGRMG